MKVYEIVADKIIESLEKGNVPWKRTWKVEAPKNFTSKKAYRGINVLLLSMAGFKSEYWLTFKQAKDAKLSIKAGSKSSIVVYWNMLDVKNTAGDIERKIPLMRYYRVFNLEQTDYKFEEAQPVISGNREQCQAIVDNMPNKPEISYGQTNPCYMPVLDKVCLPPMKQFNSVEEFFATEYHELVHSTGHATRLKRELSPLTLNSKENYSKEELVAEVGASFLCAVAGITQTFDNSVAYIQNWLKVLKDDKKMVIVAAGQAQKAADYILGNS